MRPKISLKQSWFFISFTGAILLVITFLFLTFSLPVQSSDVKFTPTIISQTAQKLVDNKLIKINSGVDSEKQASLKNPVRLKISRIKVNITLESTGLTPQGAVGVPKGLTNAAWFNLGPRPGESGSAVITGHFGYWKNGTLGVFNNLYKLHRGDEISVVDGKGSSTVFVVRKLQIFSFNEEVPSVFGVGVNDGKAHLNLITCAGTWNKILKSYPKRLVVFTDKK